VRPIGILPEEKQARLFGDYLLTQGVRNEVEHDSDGSWIIWVLDDEQLDSGKGMLEQFRANPHAHEFSRKAADAERLRVEEEKAQAQWRRRVHNRQRVFPGTRTYGAGLLTYGLIVVCAVVAVFSKLGRDREILELLWIQLPGTSGFLPQVMHGELWRVLTPVFIHYGPMHIIFNMMWLFSLGSMLESVRGSNRFAIIVLVFALGSNLAEYVFGSSIAFGGMSGVNYGLIGYVWIRGKFDPASGLHLDKQSMILAIVWFFLCLFGLIGSVANFAHAGGLILGMAWGWISAQIALRKV
jgi:GlpG protein